MKKILMFLAVLAIAALLFPALSVSRVFTPAPPVKLYNVVIMSDMTRVTFEATHITNSGFCTSLWVGSVLDTTICTPHIVTEAVEQPAEPSQSDDGDQHKKGKSKA